MNTNAKVALTLLPTLILPLSCALAQQYAVPWFKIAGGGGMQDVIEATGLHTLENVTNLIDPAILKQALDNDVLRRTQASNSPPP